MDFLNMCEGLQELNPRRMGKQSGIPLRVTATGALEGVPSYAPGVQLTYSDGELSLEDASGNHGKKRNLFSLDYGSPKNYVFPPVKKRGNLVQEDVRTWAEVQETPDNPAMIIAAPKMYLINGIKTYFRVLPVSENCMLVVLVSGALAFDNPEGTPTILARNLPDDVSTVHRGMRAVTPTTLNGYLSLKDSKSGYSYNMDLVVSIVAESTTDSFSIWTRRDESILADPTAPDRAAKLAAQKAEAAKIEAENKAAAWEASRERREAAEARARRAMAAEEDRASRAAMPQSSNSSNKRRSGESTAPKSSGSKSSGSRKSTSPNDERNAGASMFLAMLGK